VAKAASIDLSTKQFSPKIGPLFVNAVVAREARIGVRLSNVNGRVIAWLDPPARRREVQVVWDGTLAGRRVRDGYYQVELVTGGRVAAAEGFRTRWGRMPPHTFSHSFGVSSFVPTSRCSRATTAFASVTC